MRGKSSSQLAMTQDAQSHTRTWFQFFGKLPLASQDVWGNLQKVSEAVDALWRVSRVARAGLEHCNPYPVTYSNSVNIWIWKLSFKEFEPDRFSRNKCHRNMRELRVHCPEAQNGTVSCFQQQFVEGNSLNGKKSIKVSKEPLKMNILSRRRPIFCRKIIEVRRVNAELVTP